MNCNDEPGLTGISSVNDLAEAVEAGELSPELAAAIEDTWQEGIMQIRNESHVVELSEPLPCGVWAGRGGICGRDAKAAYLDKDPGDPGAYKLRPVCRVCAAASLALYEETGDGND